MRPTQNAVALMLLVATLACGGEPEPDAFGNFEAIEVVVSAETGGQLRAFEPVEGARLTDGAVVARIDTTLLALEREQLASQRAASDARRAEVSEQITVLEVQRDIARRAYERTQRLHAQQAATAQQLDQAERDYRVLVARIEALRAQRSSAASDVTSNEARVRQVAERIDRSSVKNPVSGTVLVVYSREGEIVQPGQPLYKIANLDTLDLRAYVTGDQLATIRLGGRATVRVSRGADELVAIPGTIAWISGAAEFTPTPVQTRDERADLVYAVKIRVPNTNGVLKIGMPADVTFGSGSSADSAAPAQRSEP
ncbi:MAG TPA: HlyD family efflux transporter periplasmic adaptor subunit [Gemmatimonadaceae bacterium]|nr:HlyD family efflux transporter periplasmic adaptor subunit [Gemmatimonadaceae bacterium]